MVFKIFLHVFLGVLIVIAIVAITTFVVSIYEKHLERQPHITILLGKLRSNKEDDIEKATEYLKLTNSIKDGIL